MTLCVTCAFAPARAAICYRKAHPHGPKACIHGRITWALVRLCRPKAAPRMTFGRSPPPSMPHDHAAGGQLCSRCHLHCISQNAAFQCACGIYGKPGVSKTLEALGALHQGYFYRICLERPFFFFFSPRYGLPNAGSCLTLCASTILLRRLPCSAT